MEEVTAKIDVIEALLASHNEFPSKTAEERFADLKDSHPKKPLLTFLDFSKQELKELLKEQTELLKEQQKEKNLLQEKELKQLGSSAGNRFFVDLTV